MLYYLEPFWQDSKVVTVHSDVSDERPITLTFMTLADMMTPMVDEDMGDPTQ